MSESAPQIELGKEALDAIRFLLKDNAFSTEFLVTAVNEYIINNDPTTDKK